MMGGIILSQQSPILNPFKLCLQGADITARTNAGVSALSMIVRKIPNVLPKFEDMLDHAITLAEHDINDVDCELKLDFRFVCVIVI